MPKQSLQVVVTGDHHVGSVIGLCPPRVDLDDGGVYLPSKLQTEAWNYWSKDFWPYIWRNEKKGNRQTVAVFGADGIDGDHHGTYQIWSRSIDAQVEVATQIFSPICQRVARTLFIRGTPAHVLPSGMSDEQIAKHSGAKRLPDKNTYSSYHALPIIGGLKFDIAHQGPNCGRRIWTFGNELRSYTRTVVLDAMVVHERPPDVLLRFHVHKKVWETVRDYGHKCESFISPSWQWKTEFAQKVVSHEDIADVGGLIIEIDDGEITDAYFRVLSVSQSDTMELI